MATRAPLASGTVRAARKGCVVGVARERPMDDLVEIGAFGDAPDGTRGALVYRRLHRIHAGTQQLTVTVPGSASWVGVNPRGLLFDLTPADDVRRVPRP